MIGTFNSGCAEIIVPILNRAPGGPVGNGQPGEHVHRPDGRRSRHRRRASRASTTRRASGTTPASWRRTSTRALPTRCSPSALGVKSVYILNDKEAYGLGVASNIAATPPQKLGIKVAGFEAFDPKASSYRRSPRRSRTRVRPASSSAA